MESLAGIFFSSFIIAISGALMPGPVLTVTISESSRRGFIAGPMIILGHALLEMVLLLLIVFGLANYLLNPKVIGLIGVIGGLILFLFALLMLKDLKSLSIDLTETKPASGSPFLAGILMSVANPYWTIWWASIGLGYVIMSMKFGLVGVSIFFIGHILADFAWYSGISLLVSRGKRFINVRIYRGVIAACAFILIFFGGYFGLEGVRRFL